MNKKGALWDSTLGKFIIALLVLGVLFAGYMYINKSGEGAVAAIKNLLRFRV